MANEYIRHLTESGVWQFSNVKSVGELGKLKTKTKVDVVSAINELNDYFLLNSNSISSVIETVKDINISIGDLDTSLKEEEQKLKDLSASMVTNAESVKTNINAVKSDLEGKLTTADGKIIDLTNKANELQTKFDENSTLINGKLTDINNEIINTQSELSSKISKTEFDNAVGVNKWIASFYDMTGERYNTTYPMINDITGLKASYVEEINDSVKLYPFTSIKNGLLHLFTNIRLSTAKTIALNIQHSKGMSVLLNGGYVYYQAGDKVGNVSISLRSGWNTIEILLGVKDSVGVLNTDARISDLVDKMTSVIGVGGKDETRLINNETMIKQTNEELSLKADNTVVSQLGNKIESNTAELQIQAGLIASKVSQEELNKYTGRLETAETNIAQTSKKIELLATKEEVDTLNKKVTSYDTSITQLSESIALKVNKEELNTVDGKITSALGEITLLQGEIALKASKTDLDNVTKNVTENTSSITAIAGEIALKANKLDVDAIENRIKNAETSITANTEAIKLKASQSDLDTVSGKVSSVESSLTLANNEIKTQVATISEKLALAETSITQTSEAIKLKADKKTVDDITGRLELAEASLVVANDAIATKVSSADVSSAIDESLKPISTKLTYMETTLTQNSEKIELKANSLDLKNAMDTIDGQISTINSSLTIQAGEIASKVSKGDMETYVGQTIDSWGASYVKSGEIITSLNLDKSGVKIKGELIDITGMVTFSSLDTETQAKIILGENAGNIAQEAIDIANDVDTIVDSWTMTGKTTINGGMIETDSITSAKIKTGAITADKLSATAIDGKTITGATIRTSSTATTTGGVVIDQSGIKGYNTSGTQKFSVGTTGVLTATDAIISGTLNAGESSTFAGDIKTERDVFVGNNIYLRRGTTWAEFEKKIHFDYVDSTDVGRTYIEGSRLGMDIHTPSFSIETEDGGAIDLYGTVRTSITNSFNFNRTSGYAFEVNYKPALFKNGFVVSGGTVDLSSATVTGVTAVFG